MEATVGSIVINDLLPDDLKDYNRVLDKKTTGKLLTTLAKRYPDLYKDISHKLLQFGYKAAYLTGGQSFGLDDIKESSVVKEIRDKIEQETQDVLEKWYNRGVESDDERVTKEIIGIVQKYYKALNEGALQEKKDVDSPFYRQAYGVGAQKPGTFNSIVGADLLYEDQNAKPVPIPVTRSYSKGLTPVQYFAGSFGGRKGVVDLQQATADAGFFAKQLVQIAHREVCVGDDDPEEYDEKNPRGYPVETLDPDNEGAYLAHPVGGYSRNTLLTPKILQELHKKGIDKILVRSTTVGGPANGGIYAYDAGVREFGRRPAAGEFVGINAVQSFTEKLTQTAISCLHPGTRVRMWDGSVKKLRDIQIGDELLGSDRNGKLGKTIVTNIFHQGVQPVYRHVFCKGQFGASLYATTEHKILQVVRGNFSFNVTPEISAVGTSDDWSACVFAPAEPFENPPYHIGVKKSQEWFGNVETMDIEVDNEDHLFVLANGLIVSNSKHSGGVVGADSAKGISGFKHLNQLIQVPKHFPQGAAHSTVDGHVDRIQEAPQGGTYIFINGTRHYVPQQQGQTVGLKVKVGDEVEAGDVLSEGIPNPAIVVKYKGIGEGRRAFVNQFQQALKDAGINTHRRNVEALSRGLINYVRLTDEYGDYATDDIIPYTMIASSYKPRMGCVENTPENCKGYYLEKPVLHYTIGTRITPSVIKTLNDYGVKNVIAHKEAPPFEPEMVRGMAHVSKDPDWGTRLLGGYNKDSLLEAARRGGVSYTKGTSYVPALAFGDPEFGEEGAISKRKDDWWTE